MGARRAKREYAAVKLLAAIFLSAIGYCTLISGAAGPGFGDVRPDATKTPAATLSFSGVDPIITGSVNRLFASTAFVGPNEAAKEDRRRIDVDVMALTHSFDQERVRMAALRNTPAAPIDAPKTLVADSIVAASSLAKSAQIAIAAADPSAIVPSPDNTAALNAIDVAAAPDPAIPTPASLPQQLAYARANEPVTVFEAPAPASKYSAAEINCLATAIYFESRGEAYRGQVAVAQVVMNRLRHPLYPKSICGVVYQNANMHNACQFSFACDGIPETIYDKKSWVQALDIAKQVSAGTLYLPEVANATHYHATYVYPDWAPHLRRVTKIGMHIFYKFRNA